MEAIIILIIFTAFLAAALTVPAGFGLSTMLTPVVLLVLDPHETVAVVAIVHGAHNYAKYFNLKEHVDFDAIKHYGIWLVIGAILGAILQTQVPQKPLLLVIGLFLIILPIVTLSESWSGYKIPEANDRIGGFGSGFMGGLSGHQGALRAMFLSRRLPNKMSFAATASVLALCVDLTRIPIYLYFRPEEILEHSKLTGLLVLSALIGVRVGKKWLVKWKSNTIRNGIMSGIVASGIFYLYQALS